MMQLKLNFGKHVANYHGTQPKGEQWNKQTVRGYKLCCVDLLGPIKAREKSNPEGGKTSAKYYKRLILYFPSSAWWYLDIALVSSFK